MTKNKCSLEDNIGKKFGKWTIIEPVGKDKWKHTLVKCRCECGEESITRYDMVLMGLSTQCKACSSKKHGYRYTRLYGVWKDMKRRCYNPHDSSYCYYGERGIIVCDEWKTNFLTFREWAMETGYNEKAAKGDCTIDRINTDGNYEPLNCKWSTMSEQNRNQRKRKTNTSGYTGVSFRKGKPTPWVAVVCIDYKTICLGSYKTQKEALEARNDYIIEHGLGYQTQEYKGEIKIVNDEQRKVQENWETKKITSI